MRTPDFWSRQTFGARILRTLLTPIGWIYGATVARKAKKSTPYRPQAKVICVGNLTVGGTGKTPITGYIAEQLKAKGLRVFILTRGYGGRTTRPTIVDLEQDTAEEVGDEALMLARSAGVIVARNRQEGAELADKRGAQVVLMDDGHQNFALAKDLSLVVVDAETGFGNGGIVPAGPLRESVAQGLARADAVVLVGDGSPDLQGFSKTVTRARLAPQDTASLRAKRVVAFAGIGRPEKFFQSVRGAGAEIVHTQAFGDHHTYSASEMARLLRRARTANAELITTEKDFVRLTPIEREGILTLPIRAEFEDPTLLSGLLDSVTAAV
ncbi:MAG TPA: tetraacyldisaccharide 4'-kinase [Rhizomicrobium sp.]|jgi:tetraacyldisaccharide 4'-kinase|nr:tetraacyldisaccharide 4'-kinase [Rhizomicrobium sp.]